jgi:hypothetical protein
MMSTLDRTHGLSALTRRLAARPASIVRMAAAIAALSLPCVALGAPSYSVDLRGTSETSSSPLRRTMQMATPGVAPTLVHLEACAAQGFTGARVRLDTSWPFDYQAGFGGNADAIASTDDFVIDGPPGATSVHGVFHFHVKLELDRGGGVAGSDSHIASASLRVAAAGLSDQGSCWSGNLDQGADGALAGQTPPVIDATLSLAGTFPVGSPFAVSLDLETRGQTFGDSAVSPGFTDTDASTHGLAIGDASGRVMELPSGYTVNSSSWGVVDDQATLVAGVPGSRSISFSLEAPAPNPSVGLTSLGFSLPRAGEARLMVIDLQGRLVRRLIAAPMGAGRHDVVWNGRDDGGRRVAAGIYVVELGFEGRTSVRRIARLP